MIECYVLYVPKGGKSNYQAFITQNSGGWSIAFRNCTYTQIKRTVSEEVVENFLNAVTDGQYLSCQIEAVMDLLNSPEVADGIEVHLFYQRQRQPQDGFDAVCVSQRCVAIRACSPLKYYKKLLPESIYGLMDATFRSGKSTKEQMEKVLQDVFNYLFPSPQFKLGGLHFNFAGQICSDIDDDN